jgi:hypothetical protein
MSEPPDTGVVEAPAADDWLMSSAAPAADVGPGVPAAGSPRRQVAVRAGLLAVGAAAGALVVTAVTHGSSTPTTPVANAGPRGALGANGPPGGLSGGVGGGVGGGRVDEQHVAGTLTAVGSSSVTVRTTDGTATYAVTSTTQIVRNGSVSSLASLKSGDAVFVHVYPAGSTGRLTAERIFATAGTSASAGNPT